MINYRTLRVASYVTIHCLIGCVIGEVTGLMIGVSLLWQPFATMLLATVLAFISGLFLAMVAVVSKHKTSYVLALKMVWLGEVISISGMEIGMNGIDYLIGGVNAASIYEPIFWLGLLGAIPAGYCAALPINYWLVKKHLKKCH